MPGLGLGYSIEQSVAAVAETAATSNGRASHERMAPRMQAIVLKSLMRT